MNLRALSLFTASVASLGAAFGASAESLYVINNGSVFFNQTLYTVDSDTLAVTNVTPLAAFRPGNRTLLSIDVRPATGELFGYTSNKEIVTIDPLTGVPTTIGTASSLPDVVAPAPCRSTSTRPSTAFVSSRARATSGSTPTTPR